MYQLEETILFLDKKYWYSYKQLRKIYPASIETLNKEIIKLWLLH